MGGGGTRTPIRRFSSLGPVALQPARQVINCAANADAEQVLPDSVFRFVFVETGKLPTQETRQVIWKALDDIYDNLVDCHVPGRFQKRMRTILDFKAVRVDTGKANRAPLGTATWIKLESQSLENGEGKEPSDYVGVATLWTKPDVFHGLTAWDLYAVQQRLVTGPWRESVQAKDWVGHLVAEVAGLSVETDKERIKAILRTWFKNGALATELQRDRKGNDRRFVIVGNPLSPSEIGHAPHLKKWGGESGEGGEDEPR